MAYEFQDRGIDWLKVRPRSLLGDAPGLGKTRQLILAAEGKTLVVAPAMVLDAGVWDNEVAKWRPDLEVTTTSYHSLIERLPTGKDGRLKVTDNLRPDLRHYWDTVIFDEAHHLKNRKAHWTLAAHRQIRAGKLMMATGTAIPNWAFELWSLLFMLYPGDKRFTSYWRWAKEWYVVEPTRFSPMAVQAPLEDTPAFWQRFYRENMGDRFLMRTWDDVKLDLPPLTEQTISVPMGPAQRKVYAKLKKDYTAWVEETDTEVTAWSAGGMHVKLFKVTTGLPILDTTATKGSAKLDLVKQLLEDRAGQPTLVVCHFRATAGKLAEIATKLGRQVALVHGGTAAGYRRQAVEGFQSGKYDTFVGTISTINEGITLTAANCCIFVEHSWTPSKNTQTLRRIWRIGQDHPCLIVHLVTKSTVDEHMQDVLATKTDQQVAFYSARDLAQLL